MRSVSHVSVPPCLNVSGAVRPPESGFGSPTLLRSWSAVYVATLTSDERQARGQRHERSGVGETNPYAGQADLNVLTAREGWGGQPAHGAGGQRSHEPSQRGPATGVGIRIADITALLVCRVYVAKLTSDERQADLRPPVLRAGNRFSLAILPLAAASTS